MKMTNVYQLMGAQATFHKLIMVAPERAVWMLCRPASYENTVREMLHAGLDKMRAVLEKDPFENPAKPNTKLLEIQLKITAMMDMRVNGAPTQKIQQLNLSGNLGRVTGEDVRSLTEKGDMTEIQKRLERLRARKAAAEGRGLPAPVVGAAEGDALGAGAGALAEGEALVAEPIPARVEIVRGE
jgi:hypothetical protein